MKFSHVMGASLLALGLGAGIAPGTAAAADVGPNTTPGADGIVFANVSISVADLAKSAKFYQALGFEAGAATPLPAPIAKLLGGKADAKLQIQFLKRDGVALELVNFAPAPAKAASTGSAGQLGLAHIAIRVDNVDRVAKIVTENGGKTLDKTRTKLGPIDILFVTDPDGTRIEVASQAKS
ncbi:MAG TPA: VOC family protein [Alphaproteobacteria bacterium]|nr:VOC family protein [Alphaproteobacteria bacterium]